jgi:hypothetical protein
MVLYELDSSDSAEESAAISFTDSNEHSSSTQYWKILEQLSYWWLLKKDSASQSYL